MLSDMTGKYPSQTEVIDQGFYEGGKYAGFAYWTSFNQHGWDVGAVGAPDMELESNNEVSPSMMNSTDPKAADYLGVAVHEANGQTVVGSSNLPYLYNAASWSDPSKTLGGFPGWSDDSHAAGL